MVPPKGFAYCHWNHVGQRTKVSVFASEGLVSLYQTIHLVTFQPTLFDEEGVNLLGNCFMQAQSKPTR